MFQENSNLNVYMVTLHVLSFTPKYSFSSTKTNTPKRLSILWRNLQIYSSTYFPFISIISSPLFAKYKAINQSFFIINYRNKGILFAKNMTQVKNISLEQYENVIASIAPEQFNSWELENCSLASQLDSAAEGTGLAFIVFTQAIVELPWSPIWAVLFFTMLLSLGLGSQIGILEGMLCTLFDIDIFKRIRKPYVTGKSQKLIF